MTNSALIQAYQRSIEASKFHVTMVRVSSSIALFSFATILIINNAQKKTKQYDWCLNPLWGTAFCALIISAAITGVGIGRHVKNTFRQSAIIDILKSRGVTQLPA